MQKITIVCIFTSFMVYSNWKDSTYNTCQERGNPLFRIVTGQKIVSMKAIFVKVYTKKLFT